MSGTPADNTDLRIKSVGVLIRLNMRYNLEFRSRSAFHSLIPLPSAPFPNGVDVVKDDFTSDAVRIYVSSDSLRGAAEVVG